MTETCVCCGDIIPEGRQVCPKCEQFAEDTNVRSKNVGETNADRIRSMSDEELADVFDHVQGDAFLVGVGERKNSVYPGAGVSWLDWLKSPVEVME